jgi:nitrogen fixation protein
MDGESIIRVAPLGGFAGKGVPARGWDRKSFELPDPTALIIIILSALKLR